MFDPEVITLPQAIELYGLNIEKVLRQAIAEGHLQPNEYLEEDGEWLIKKSTVERVLNKTSGNVVFLGDAKTGLANTQKVADDGETRLGKDALARLLGIKLLEMKPGYARASMKVNPELLNGEGVTHGGAIFSLADFVLAAAGSGRISLSPGWQVIKFELHYRSVSRFAPRNESNLCTG